MQSLFRISLFLQIKVLFLLLLCKFGILLALGAYDRRTLVTFPLPVVILGTLGEHNVLALHLRMIGELVTFGIARMEPTTQGSTTVDEYVQ